MSMEGETGDLLVRVILDGSERVIRLSGSAAVMSGKLLIFLSALLKKGKTRDIALNPGGMCMVTIKEDYIKEFAKLAKKYHLPYFIAKDKLHEKGYQDICAKMEDASVINRICEKLGIARLDKDSEVLNAEDFKSAAEAKRQTSVTFSRALNRVTEKDYSKDTPRYICERTNPDRYIELYSSRASYRGEEYTKTKYIVYKDGEKVGEYHDGRFDGRDRNYWISQRESMKEAGGFSDDIVFFDEAVEFDHYREIHEMQNMGEPVSAKDLKERIEKDLDSVKIGDTDKNPLKASESLKSGAGAKNTKSEKQGKIHSFVEGYKKNPPIKHKEKVKELAR